MDRRLTPATPRIAHVSLKGRVEVPVYTDGTAMRVSLPLADLLRAPNGARERQLLLGAAFTVIDRHEDHAFGFADKDGYCGWLPDAALSRGPTPTHWVCTPGTHLYPEPKVQAREICALSLGAEVAITAEHGAWAETTQGFLPSVHLLPLGQHLADPVAVAESLLHTPYLWGGNSRAGLDCSGLVQLAFAACGIALIVTLLVMGWAVVAMALAAAATSLFLARAAKARIGGQTGDILGASQQLAEAAALAFAAARLT